MKEIEKTEDENFHHSCKKRTLCEVLRELADIHQDSQNPHDREVRKLLSECEGMAKRMNRKLKEYKTDYDKGWYEKNKDYVADLEKRLNTKYVMEFDSGEV